MMFQTTVIDFNGIYNIACPVTLDRYRRKHYSADKFYCRPSVLDFVEIS